MVTRIIIILLLSHFSLFGHALAEEGNSTKRQLQFPELEIINLEIKRPSLFQRHLNQLRIVPSAQIGGTLASFEEFSKSERLIPLELRMTFRYSLPSFKPNFRLKLTPFIGFSMGITQFRQWSDPHPLIGNLQGRRFSGLTPQLGTRLNEFLIQAGVSLWGRHRLGQPTSEDQSANFQDPISLDFLVNYPIGKMVGLPDLRLGAAFSWVRFQSFEISQVEQADLHEALSFQSVSLSVEYEFSL